MRSAPKHTPSPDGRTAWRSSLTTRTIRTIQCCIVLGLCVSAIAAAPGPSKPDPDRAMADFVAAYWDADFGYFLAWNRSAPFPRPGGAGPKGGQYADFWWAAQCWDVVLDAYGRDPKPEYRKLIDSVYDGFVKQYPDFLNDYNDDLGWWAQASLRAYGFTGDKRYLERAKGLFDDIWTYWDAQFGGVSWRRSNRMQRNVATNGPLAVIAVRLFQATGDRGYLERAQRLWDFVDSKLTDGDTRVWDNLDNGELRRWDFTYNVGNFVLASLALREVSEDAAVKARLLERSRKATDWALGNLTNAGILLDEGTGDGGGFKGVFVRGLAKLAAVADLDPGVRERYAQALADNATQVWNARRPSDGLVGADWSSQPGIGVIEALTAASATAALQLAPGGLEGRYVPGDGNFEAENSVREGVAPSIKAPGYSGRGYINDFRKAGQFVAFRVNVAEAGRYALRFRYSAGGGSAVRGVFVTSKPPFNLEFASNMDWSNWQRAAALEFQATPDWLTWGDAALTVDLPAGSSAIAVRFEREGSRNWLNLDRLKVERQP